MIRPRRSWTRRAIRWMLVSLGLFAIAGVALFIQRRVTHNFAVVIPDTVYRSAGMSETVLSQVIQRYGIKTVIQLNETSYRDLAGEDMIVERGDGYTHCRLRWSSESEPGTREARGLLRAIEQNEAPYLIQCRNGANRSAVAAAMARILLSDASLSEARGELVWQRGWVGFMTQTRCALILDHYRAWLQSNNRQSGGEALKTYLVGHHYPGFYKAEYKVSRATDTLLELSVENISRYGWPADDEDHRFQLVVYQKKQQGEHSRGHRLATVEFPLRRVGIGESVDFSIPLQLRDASRILALTIKVTGEAWFHQRNDEFFTVPIPDISTALSGSGASK